jgi:predicted nucleic acid-binding protein
MNETDATAVADAGPLIHLHEVKGLRLLLIFEAVSAPRTVWQEATQAGRVPSDALQALANLMQVDDPPSDSEAHFAELDAGERACLRLCRRERISLLLTDDLEAREAAREEGVTPVGTLGVVLRACREERFTKEERLTKQEAEQMLEALRDESTLFVRPVLVNRVIGQL